MTISSQAVFTSNEFEREIAQPGGLGLTDPVLRPNVLTVAQFQAGELAGQDLGGGVGDEPGDPVPAGVGEPQLRTRIRGVPCAGSAGSPPAMPKGLLDGDFGDPRAVAGRGVGVGVGVDRRLPRRTGVEYLHGVADSDVTKENPTPDARQAAKPRVAPAESQRIRTFGASGFLGLGRYRGGNDSSAQPSTVM